MLDPNLQWLKRWCGSVAIYSVFLISVRLRICHNAGNSKYNRVYSSSGTLCTTPRNLLHNTNKLCTLLTTTQIVFPYVGAILTGIIQTCTFLGRYSHLTACGAIY